MLQHNIRSNCIAGFRLSLNFSKLLWNKIRDKAIDLWCNKKVSEAALNRADEFFLLLFFGIQDQPNIRKRIEYLLHRT
jgi:hypothetical protein